MRVYFVFFFSLFTFHVSQAQKKPLDHTVYDGWQSIGERMISNDGKWVVYSINVQEGDNELVIQSSDAKYKKTIPRGYNAVISEDSRFAIFKIRPLYKDTRDARIKKKRPDDMPKDSFAVVELGRDSVFKLSRVKTYKTPEKGAGWVAWHLEKKPETDKPKQAGTDQSIKVVDSLRQTIDSLKALVNQLSKEGRKKKKNKDDDEEIGNWQSATYNDLIPDDHDSRLTTPDLDADGDDPVTPATPEGTDLVLKNLLTGEEKTFPLVSEYYFDKKGKKLLLETTRNSKDSLSKASVALIDLGTMQKKTISEGGNDFKNYAFSEDGSRLAFVAERNAKPKELQKFYKLWYYSDGADSAIMVVDKNSVGMKLGMTVSEFGTVSFSKTGRRLFFGTAPIQPPKDTTLVDFETAKVDVWHYKDDYLQTVQLSRLQRDLQENFLAVYDIASGGIRQLGSKEIPTVLQTNEGDGEIFVGITDFGKRVESQWTGNTLKDIYTINVADGTKQLVIKDLNGFTSPQYISPTGKYIMWYDRKTKNYFTWNGERIRNISSKIKTSLWNEENETPDLPPPYGVMAWEKDDKAVLIYDRFGVWRMSPGGSINPQLVVDDRKNKRNYRYIRVNPEERFLEPGQLVVFRTFSDANKKAGLWQGSYSSNLNNAGLKPINADEQFFIGQVAKAENADVYLFTKENYNESPNIYVAENMGGKITANLNDPPVDKSTPIRKLSSINPQQGNYYWGTVQLIKWKAYNGKETEGIVFKPENFDPKKKYPLICYFYETLSDGLYTYQPPSPTPSRLNIPFFVSRGYVVLAPDIHYGTGHPARDAYNHVVSGARYLVKQGYVDSTRIGIQGQSWGGIQVAQLITMTKLFKAAWAGAPVANMTSAYGGIRWESGLNRQFQYEKSQSRIGATLWEKPNLYIENSPLFHLPKVTTPLVIMHNDADGAVPWYQGIELFTAMRRLGKKVWMLNYNGEAHNLVERRNRKDIQIREQQFFDWLLKGEPAPKWIREGVPAVKKGRDWGLEY
ncbi:MAG TPA: prolyl oligopeptidase family serine peptidase [Chitinophagaceae bacterium]|nr:prolyl oligopeptidase family serine peptidase [Chitinophagaceae bacterium]